MESSLRDFTRRLLPTTTLVGRLLRAIPKPPETPQFINNYIYEVEPKLWHKRVTVKTADPLFSLVVPMFNTPEAYLRPLLDSVTNQTFTRFEAILADASTDESSAARIKRLAAGDPRFKYLRLTENCGISANTNAALRLATAPYVVFCDHDDVLDLHALNEVAARIAKDPSIDVLYSDEDKLSNDGLTRRLPAFKPRWSPHMFLMCNYTNHLSVIRRSIINEIGGLRPEFDGAQDYDLLLRIHSLGRPIKVKHIPSILYHWRESAQSTSSSLASKSYAVKAGRDALSEYLDRLGICHAGVEDLAVQPSWHRIKPRWCAKVAVVCAGTAAGYIETLRQATVASVCRPTWISQPDGFDPTALPAKMEAVVVVSRCYLPDEPEWLDDLVGALVLPAATVVAPLLAARSGLVESAGVAIDALGVFPILRGDSVNSGNAVGLSRMIRDVDAISRPVYAVKRDDLDLVAPIRGMLCQDMVTVPPERGNAVVWGPTSMRRHETFFGDDFISPYLGLGVMGWSQE